MSAAWVEGYVVAPTRANEINYAKKETVGEGEKRA